MILWTTHRFIRYLLCLFVSGLFANVNASVNIFLNFICDTPCMKKSAIYDWIQRFWDGREDMNDNPGHGWRIETRTPSTIKNFCPGRPNWMRSCIWTSSDVSTNEFVGFGLSCGRTTLGCSTKIMHPCTLPLKFTTFLQKIKWMCWTTHHIHSISLRATFLFCKIKNDLKGYRFQSVENILKNSTAALKGIKEEEFSVCFEQWKHRMEKCI